MIVINTNLRELRKNNRINQEQLANEIGTCRKTISMIERCELNPSILLALQIAQYFNKSVDEMFWIEEK
ncbi:helix-turn-helix transcriptional regulator [Lachnospiraceae bacterium LCP25S3_G4]